MKKIGVGIIGASLGGWAALSHVPALKVLPDYELRAISTSRRESAEAAAKEFDVAAAFDDPADLIPRTLAGPAQNVALALRCRDGWRPLDLPLVRDARASRRRGICGWRRCGCARRPC